MHSTTQTYIGHTVIFLFGCTFNIFRRYSQFWVLTDIIISFHLTQYSISPDYGSQSRPTFDLPLSARRMFGMPIVSNFIHTSRGIRWGFDFSREQYANIKILRIKYVCFYFSYLILKPRPARRLIIIRANREPSPGHVQTAFRLVYHVLLLLYVLRITFNVPGASKILQHMGGFWSVALVRNAIRLPSAPKPTDAPHTHTHVIKTAWRIRRRRRTLRRQTNNNIRFCE